MHFFLVLVLLFVSACEERPEHKVLARVNGTNIEIDLFTERLHEFHMGEKDALVPSPETMELKRQVLQEMILEVLMLKEAQKRKIDVSPAMLRKELQSFEKDYPPGTFDEFLKMERMTRSRFRDRLRNQLLLRQLREDVCKDLERPTQDEIQSFYEANEDRFQKKEQVRIQQIVVKTLEDGEKVRREAKTEGTSFEDLARKHSFGPEGAQGGDLGFIDLDSLPEPLAEAIEKISLNEISPVVESEYGFHVVKVVDRQKPEQLSLEKASEQIRKEILRGRCEEKFTEWRHGILNNSRIERNHALLSKIR